MMLIAVRISNVNSAWLCSVVVIPPITKVCVIATWLLTGALFCLFKAIVKYWNSLRDLYVFQAGIFLFCVVLFDKLSFSAVNGTISHEWHGVHSQLSTYEKCQLNSCRIDIHWKTVLYQCKFWLVIPVQ